MTTGIGYDCHRLVAGRRLVLGGVELENELGLEGHSDADVLTHAIIDAMLGACALGDIGQHFPDTDPRYRGADSIELLRATLGLLRDAGFAAAHVDATVVIERPKLAPARDAMRARLAAALELDVSHVSVKATRGEGMGFVGRERAWRRWRWPRSVSCRSPRPCPRRRYPPSALRAHAARVQVLSPPRSGRVVVGPASEISWRAMNRTSRSLVSSGRSTWGRCPHESIVTCSASGSHLRTWRPNAAGTRPSWVPQMATAGHSSPKERTRSGAIRPISMAIPPPVALAERRGGGEQRGARAAQPVQQQDIGAVANRQRIPGVAQVAEPDVVGGVEAGIGAQIALGQRPKRGLDVRQPAVSVWGGAHLHLTNGDDRPGWSRARTRVPVCLPLGFGHIAHDHPA